MVEDQPGAAFRPAVPDWLRAEVPERYTSVYEVDPSETRIYGTESLYGNWHGKLLVLAQDFANAEFVRARKAARHPRPFSHDPRNKTNLRLCPLLEESGLTTEALYGSALGGALKETDGTGDELPNRAEARRYGERVVGFTVDTMPNLKAISCLGVFAWECVWRAFGLGTLTQASQDRRRLLRAREPYLGHRDSRPIGLFAHVHTSTRGINSHPRKTAEAGSAWRATQRDWETMAAWIRANS